MKDNLIELIAEGTDRFEMFSMESELVKAYEDPKTGKKMFKGIASSTTKDLHGDTITLSALQDMELSAVGLTMFLNHSYNVPADVGGTITKAKITQKGVDHNGDPAYLLEIEGEVEEDNEAALQTWKFVQKGRKIGLSIGAMIPAKGATRQKDGSYIIEHLDLLEVSFVGIPANPKSWVEYAASALRGLAAKGQTTNLGNPTLTLEAGRYKIEGSLDGLDLGLGGTPDKVATLLGENGEPLTESETSWSFAWDRDNKVAISRCVTTPMDDGMSAEMSVTPLGAWDLTDPDDRLLAIASAGEDAINKATVWVETRDGDKITIGDPVETSDGTALGTDPDVTKTKCATCAKEGCTEHKAAPDPDVADAKIRVIEVDTDDQSSGDGSQGASSSEPDDAEYAAPEADITAAGELPILDGLPLDELTKLSFGQLQAIALRAVTELVAAKQALGEEKAARIAAEAQREAVVEAAAELVQRAAAVIEKVANAPLPRKALLKGIEKEFSTSVEQFYGAEFARALAAGK